MPVTLVPKGETSIPRLELIAAVMAVQLEGHVKRELNLDLRPVYSGQTQLLFYKAYAMNASVFLRSFIDVSPLGTSCAFDIAKVQLTLPFRSIARR